MQTSQKKKKKSEFAKKTKKINSSQDTHANS